jgi:hypothetical protein
MLKPGLYEQIISQSLSRELASVSDTCKHVEKLENKGFEVSHITFAPDYIEEICKHDIQLTPISIGTGTKGKVLDADVIAFVSMAGNVITTRPYRGKRADIRTIPDGIYTLRSVNKKGVTHRVGMVYIRR